MSSDSDQKAQPASLTESGAENDSAKRPSVKDTDESTVNPGEPLPIIPGSEVKGFDFRSRGILGVRLPGGLSAQALLMAYMGILAPAVFYSLRLVLAEPSPSDILVAICLALFATLVYLWILDATDVLRFRSEWVSRGVYGAAIVSILGTSAGMYRDVLKEDTSVNGPYEGAWDLRLLGDQGIVVAVHQVLLVYSKNSESYWGRSDLVLSGDGQFSFVYVDDFEPLKGDVVLRHRTRDAELSISMTLLEERKGSAWKGQGGPFTVQLVRSK